MRWPAKLAFGVGALLTVGTLLYQAATLTVERIRLTERIAVQQVADSSLAVETARSDSLAHALRGARAVVAQRDSQLTVALQQAQRVIVREVPFVPASLIDTTATRVALNTLHADAQQCRDALTGVMTACELYRKSADSALAVGASLRTADSTSLHRLAEQSATWQRGYQAANAQLARQSKWRTLQNTTCAVSLATNFIQWRAR